MFRFTTRNQIIHAAAILAVALLCAQTLVVVHDHELSETELCAVCSTSAEHADATSPAIAVDARPAAAGIPAYIALAPAKGSSATHQARAPPHLKSV